MVHFHSAIDKQQFREWIRAVRNHPSVVMYSTDNETVVSNFVPVSSQDRYLLDTAYRLQQVVQEEDSSRLIDHQGVQPTCSDPRFQIGNYHYPPIEDVDNWQQKYGKPLLLGEVSYENVWSDPGDIALLKKNGQDWRTPYWTRTHTAVNHIGWWLGQYMARAVAGVHRTVR